MKASDAIVRFLEVQGIDVVFGYQGGMITHLVDSLSRSEKVRFVPCYHEQSAAFAAEGYARMSGKFGVCMTTSGPGATNALTSVGNAFFDSIPVLYVTGQVNSYEYKYDAPLRQRGFQETDIVSVARPLVKWTRLCDDPDCLLEDFRHAVSVMNEDRKGPALLDVPMNVQRADIQVPDDWLSAAPVRLLSPGDSERARRLVTALAAAERPLVLCGGGIVGAVEEDVADFLKRSGLPYVVSLMGKGLVDETDPACMGMIGSYGNRCANLAFAEADVVLALGSRLDLRQTGSRQSPILNDKLFLRVEVDQAEIEGNALPRQVAYHGGVKGFFEAVGDCGAHRFGRPAWRRRLEILKTKFSQASDVSRFAENRLPYDVLAALAETAPDNAVFVADVGQNQMWSAQTIRTGRRQRFLTSGGMAPMGYALPAAVGAAFVDPSRPVFCIVGDGGLHMSLQTLPLISQYRLPVTVVLLNNRALGMITQFQRLYFEGNLAGTVAEGGYLTPEFSHIAAAYGLEYVRIDEAGGLDAQDLSGKFIEVRINGLTNVVPKLEYNRGLDDMTPSFGGIS